jgi:hypothetical protein
MEDFSFRLKWVLWILGGYLGGRLLVLFLEKVAHLPFYAWQETVIGCVGVVVALYLFSKKIDGENK